MNYCRTLLCLILALALAPLVRAETIEGLIAAGKLEARVVVETPVPYYQKAPIVIDVEVGTPRWFKRGTRVRDFTVPGAVARPASKFAFNSTQRRDGDTWSFQSWSFQVYAERAGELRIPALTTFISVDTEAHGVVEGEVQLEVPALQIEAPPGTEGLTFWVAATGFEAEESWEGLLETYQIGDAVTRVRRFTIDGVPAMAIPASPPVELDGVHVYHAPALVDDKAVRGALEGVREERVVFTVEARGTHIIPGHQIHWFNLETETVDQIDFPSHTLDVSSAGDPAAAATAEPRDKTGHLLFWGLAVLVAALGYLFFRWLRRTTGYHTVRDHLEAWRGRRRVRTAFMRAAAQQDSRRCLALLYARMAEHSEWQLSTACASDPELSAVSAVLMAHAYGDGPSPDARDLERLWKVCATRRKSGSSPSALRLNPGSAQ